MILDAADLNRSHLMLASDAAYVSPDTSFDIAMKQLLTVLRAEHNMEIYLRPGVCHMLIRRDATGYVIAIFRGFKPTATFT
jgi:hypothetical protein